MGVPKTEAPVTVGYGGFLRQTVRLEVCVINGSWERNNVTYVTHAGYVYNETFKTEAET